MNRFFWTLYAVLVLCLPVKLAWSQWVPARGEAVASSEGRQAIKGYHWVRSPKTPAEIYLYENNCQIGGYSFASGFYLPWDGQRWGRPSIPPIAVPLEGKAGEDGQVLFGVVADKISQVEHFECRDKTHSREAAYALLALDLDDTSKRPSFTIIDADASRRDQIANAWLSSGSLSDARKSWLFQAYDPGSPITQAILAPFQLARSEALQKGGFLAMAQAPPGPGGDAHVLGQWHKWDGADPLAEALRKVDPNFDPNKIPVPGLPGLPAFNATELLIAGGLGVLVVVALMNRRKGP